MGASVTVRLEVPTPSVRQGLAEIVRAVPGLELREGGGKVDLLILEIGLDPTREFQRIHQAKERGEAGEVFLTSARAEPELLLHALRAGAREFFVQPLRVDEVRDTLGAFARQRLGAGTGGACRTAGRLVYLIGSKGGVGTTTVAVNLAAALAAADGARRVALIDMNYLFGEVPLFLDMEPAFNWGEVAKNIARLDATYLMGVLARHASGVYVLPSPSHLDRLHAATPETVEKLVRVMRLEFDFIVVDGGQSIDEVSLKLMELADTVLVISILSLPCLINVRRLFETFAGLGYPRPADTMVVVNRHHRNSTISLKEAEEGIGRAIDWKIPNDYPASMSAINTGRLLAAVAPRSDITRNLRDLAAHVAAGPSRRGGA